MLSVQNGALNIFTVLIFLFVFDMRAYFSRPKAVQKSQDTMTTLHFGLLEATDRSNCSLQVILKLTGR